MNERPHPTPHLTIFSVAHIEITNHVALGLPSLSHHHLHHHPPPPLCLSHDLRLSPKAGRVPVGAAATQNSLNDLMVIQSISLQQRNLSILERNQYELVTV